MIEILDTIIVGGGPAGLAAGMVLKSNRKKYLILEKGKDLVNRDPNDPKDVAMGVGGGGLFSDGKLSFPPSATYLWTQLNSSKLKESYEYLYNVFDDININLPVFENEWTFYHETYSESQFNKNYSSILLNNFMRTRVLNLFYETNLRNIVTNCCVIKIEKTKTFYSVLTENNKIYYCNQIILACGKFGNSIFKKIDFMKTNSSFNKIEMGIRVESTSDAFIPYKSLTMDYKKIGKIENNVEFRTFCCCKDGVVLKSEFDNYVSFNGARSQFKTHKSNIGILIRASDIQSIYYREMENLLKLKSFSFKIPIEKYLHNNKIYIGKYCDGFLRSKIQKLINMNKTNSYTFTVYGPEIEYIGKYVNNNDLILSDNIWIAGDVTGKFRGLIPALISGIYSAKNCVRKSNDNIKKDINKLGINISSEEEMKLIFTAQSKRFFYCKEVICQYVLKQEKLPINPFQVFGYFLNDRVERDAIRRGNNQLIKSCEELWVFGPIADGVLFEIALAKLNGKKIRFFTIGTRIDEIEEINHLSNITFEPEVHSKKIKKDDLIKFIFDTTVNDRQIELDMNL